MAQASEEIIGIYERHAQSFDRLRQRLLFEKEWMDRFLAVMPAHPFVLDLGCGSAEPIAAYLIEKGCFLTGVDTSEGLLHLCQQRFPQHTWIKADMRKLVLHQTFHGLLAWDSFFHLTAGNQRKMFKIFSDHAMKGSVLMFTSGPAAGESIGDFEGEPLYHASLDAQEYRDLLQAHHFEVISHIAEDPDCGGHTVWLAKVH